MGRGNNALQMSVSRLEGVLDDFLARVDAGEDVPTALRNLEQVLLGQLPVHLERLRNALDPAPVGIEDLMAERVDHYLNELVNQEGKPKDGGGWGYNEKGQTRAEWIANHVAEQVWNRKLMKAVDTAIGDARKKVDDRIRNEIAEKLRGLLGL